MNKDSKIYIAGHKGLVGSSILRKLEREGFTNIIYRTSGELDLTDQAAVLSFFKREKPEYVFLAAARVGGIYANNTYPAEFIYRNIMIETNIIHSAYLSGSEKLLFLGSSCIYPRLCPQPIKEEYLLTGPLEPTNEAYAIAKIAGLEMCRFYKRQYGRSFISAMPTNLYGINDNFDLEKSHVLPAIIRKMHLGKAIGQDDWKTVRKDLDKNPVEGIDGKADSQKIISILSKYGIGEEVTLWGTGKPRREFMYVDDLADALLFLMNNYDGESHVNIGTGEDLEIGETARLIAGAVGFKGNIVHDLDKPDGTPRKLLDVSLLRNCGWTFKTGLEEGIRKTYEWYINRD
ncbi:MAG: GDP-L-fucose synthase [Brevinematales bacterium]|jgi:GDP-L-fucose synthase